MAFQSAGVADYNTLANGVRNAAQANRKYLCTVDRTATPNVMTCILSVTLSAAEIAEREPLRRLDANGNPLGWARLAGNANGAN